VRQGGTECHDAQSAPKGLRARRDSYDTGTVYNSPNGQQAVAAAYEEKSVWAVVTKGYLFCSLCEEAFYVT
jgi:hypothetical protein